MQVWFSKFIRGRVFSVLFCILGFGLTIYLSSRLGILIEGFAGLDLQLAIFLILTVFCTYMLIYVNIHRENKKTQKLFNLCGIIFSFFPSISHLGLKKGFHIFRNHTFHALKEYFFLFFKDSL